MLKRTVPDFVNYNKRDVSLPPGCKDLIDLLKPALSAKDLVADISKSGLSPTVMDLINLPTSTGNPEFDRLLKRLKDGTRRRESAMGPISDLPHHVETLFASPALSYTLWLTTTDQRLTTSFHKMLLRRQVTASVTVEEKTDQERAVLEFLSSRSLKIPKNAGLPVAFNIDAPNLPVYLICQISPLPPNPKDAAQLLLDLFRHTGLPDETVIKYERFEVLDSDPPEGSVEKGVV